MFNKEVQTYQKLIKVQKYFTMFVYAILTTHTFVCLVGKIFVGEKRDNQGV